MNNFTDVSFVDAAEPILSVPEYPSAYRQYSEMSAEFQQFHQKDLNIFLHFLTTPLGFLGFLGLIRSGTNSSTIVVVLSLLYMLSLIQTVTSGALIGTAIICIALLAIARSLRLSAMASMTCIALGFALQEAAHWMVKEDTYAGSYSESKNWFSKLVHHTYYLIPLCVDLLWPKLGLDPKSSALAQAVPEGLRNLYTYWWVVVPLVVWNVGSYCLDSKNGFCFFPGSPYRSRVLTCNLVTQDSESRKQDLKKIRDWALKRMPSKNMSSHWWFRDLDEDVMEAFERCAKSSIINSMFRGLFSERHYCFEIVEGMNEVYVTGPAREDEAFNSDHVFYARHVDGPMGLIPFASVYRCIVGMDKNLATMTHFPLNHTKMNAMEGDVLAFDFNREIHYITRDKEQEAKSDEFRVVLKLHYCAYPRVLAPLGWAMHYANVAYNMTFRALFLKTIDPKTLYEHFLAWQVIFNTSLFNNIETFIGQRNLVYLLLSGFVSYIVGDYQIFRMMTSYLHYLRYIGTYYFRKDVDYGSFKRDVFLFKGLELVQLGLVYLFPHFMAEHVLHIPPVNFSFDPISILMIISGYTVSTLATKALGIDRTYFGAELGHCEPKWVNDFPYEFIPHPMIVSQIWALLGMYKAVHMRTLLPYAVPIHIVLYSVHMVQEHFEVYQKVNDMPKSKIA